MKNCPKCNNLWPDEHLYCPICGVDLVFECENSNINMGDANAISGGVHSTDDHSKKDSDNVVNSNNVTHSNSHNTTNNTTIYEATKSESEKLEENRLKYRLECKKLFQDGIISKEGERELRELQVNLNLADELVLPIKQEVQKQSKKRKTQMTLTGLADIRQTKSIIEQNTAPALQRQLVKLESWMQEYDDNTLKFMYYQMSSMLEPIRYTNRYEDGVKDEYWEVYWAYIAYLLQNREMQANEALASLGRWHSYYPEQNDAILLIAGRLMQNEPIEGIKQVRKFLTIHYTQDLKLLLDSIDELLEKDWTKEPICIRPAHSFYITTLFGRFVETQKAKGEESLIKIREQENLKHAEAERKRQEELNKQNQIRNQKEIVIQVYLENGQIDRACREAGVSIHTFNIWLDEDPTFASTYSDAIRSVEAKRLEEREKKHRQQELETITKEKKRKFKVLFEQNKCDVLKTCSEIGVSSADYQEWRRLDPVFNDEINYIIRSNEEAIEDAIKQNRAKTIKKLRPFVLVAIILCLVFFGVNQYVASQEATAKAKVSRLYENKKNDFEVAYRLIDSTPNGINELDKAYDIVKEMKKMEEAEHFCAAEILSLRYLKKLDDISESLIKECSSVITKKGLDEKVYEDWKKRHEEILRIKNGN